MAELQLKVYGRIDEKMTETITAALDAAPDANPIVIRVHSDGGSVDEAIVIHNRLKAAKGRKVVHIDGVAASAAPMIVAAGDEIHMAANAVQMLHAPRVKAVGNLADVEALAVRLRLAEDQMAGILAGRTGMSDTEVRAMLKSDKWLKASAAKELGLATHIGAQATIVACADLAAYGDLPDFVQPWAETAAATTTATTGTAATAVVAQAEAVGATASAVTAEAKTIVVAEGASDVATTLAAERERARHILAACRLARADEQADALIASGLSIEAVRSRLLEVVCERHVPIGEDVGRRSATSATGAAADPDAELRAEYQKDVAIYARQGLSFEDFKVVAEFERDGLEFAR
jgi:ATP-dependent Clp protease, protease subunit